MKPRVVLLTDFIACVSVIDFTLFLPCTPSNDRAASVDMDLPRDTFPNAIAAGTLPPWA